MPNLNQPAPEEHPWRKKHGSYKKRDEKKVAKVAREVAACPLCDDPHCYFGECDGREF